MSRRSRTASTTPSPSPEDACLDAVRNGDAPGVMSALRLGADPNAAPDGTPPLVVALNRGAIAVMEPLVSAGAELGAIGEDGHTPLHLLAVMSVRQDDPRGAIAELVRLGADIDAADGRGVTPLGAAIIHGNAHAAAALIDRGALVPSAKFIDDPVRVWVWRSAADLLAMPDASPRVRCAAWMLAADLGLTTDAPPGVPLHGPDDATGWAYACAFAAPDTARGGLIRQLSGAAPFGPDRPTITEPPFDAAMTAKSLVRHLAGIGSASSDGHGVDRLAKLVDHPDVVDGAIRRDDMEAIDVMVKLWGHADTLPPTLVRDIAFRTCRDAFMDAEANRDLRLWMAPMIRRTYDEAADPYDPTHEPMMPIVAAALDAGFDLEGVAGPSFEPSQAVMDDVLDADGLDPRLRCWFASRDARREPASSRWLSQVAGKPADDPAVVWSAWVLRSEGHRIEPMPPGPRDAGAATIAMVALPDRRMRLLAAVAGG